MIRGRFGIESGILTTLAQWNGIQAMEVILSKKRIQIYADDETIRRVELAAEKHSLPVTTYCLTAIQHQLEEDGIEVESTPTQFQDLIAELRELQERILQERGGQPVNVNSLLEQLREERDEESLSMR
jgi:hypothetical protein